PARDLELAESGAVVALPVVGDPQVVVRLEERRVPFDDLLVGRDGARRVAAVEVHGGEIGACAGVVGAERQVALEERDRLGVVVAVVVEVGEAAEGVGILPIAVEDVLEGGQRVGLVGGVELSGARFDLSQLEPGLDVVGLRLRLGLEVGNEGHRLGGQRHPDLGLAARGRCPRRRGAGPCSPRARPRTRSGGRDYQGPDGETRRQEQREHRRARGGELPAARGGGRGIAGERRATLRAELGAGNGLRTALGAKADRHWRPRAILTETPRAAQPRQIGGGHHHNWRQNVSADLQRGSGSSRHTTCFAWRPRMSKGVQILLVEDDSAKRCAAVRALAPTGRAVIEAATGADALAVLRRGGDFIVLLALALPDMDGRDLLARIAADHPDTPAVIVTGVDDVAVAIDAMQRGAWDYVVARADGSHLVHLPHVLARTLERLQLVRDRNRYREEVEALAIALRGTTDGVVILDPVGRIAFVNRALAQAWRQPESAIVGRHLGDFVSMHGAQVELGDVLAAIGARGRWSGELSTRTVEAPERVWDVMLTPIRCPEPAPGGLLGHARTAVGIFRDVSEKYALEQLRADFLSMITHDIQVPLTVILGYTEMLTDPDPPPDQLPPDLLPRLRDRGE